MDSDKNRLLILAAMCTALAAIAHLGCIVFGGDWYRFFGAGEEMAQLSEQGHWYPTAVTSTIVAILLLCSLYALSGARVILRLPLLRTGLCTISSIFLLRGVAFFGITALFPGNSLLFWLVSSGICLGIGMLFAAGATQAWPKLSAKKP